MLIPVSWSIGYPRFASAKFIRESLAVHGYTRAFTYAAKSLDFHDLLSNKATDSDVEKARNSCIKYLDQDFGITYGFAKDIKRLLFIHSIRKLNDQELFKKIANAVVCHDIEHTLFCSIVRALASVKYDDANFWSILLPQRISSEHFRSKVEASGILSIFEGYGIVGIVSPSVFTYLEAILLEKLFFKSFHTEQNAIINFAASKALKIYMDVVDYMRTSRTPSSYSILPKLSL